MKNFICTKRIQSTVQAIFVILFFGFIIDFTVHKPRILIIHSYDTDYQWVLDIDEGLNRVLNNHPEFFIDRIYMNTKNNPSKTYGDRIGINVRNMVSDINPDLIIAVNNDAQQYVAKYYIDDPKIKIVFTGINGEPEDFGYEKAHNVTGFLNRIPGHNLHDFLVDMSKQKGRPLVIASIGDKSQSVIQDTARLDKIDWAPNTILPKVLVGTFDEWKKAFADIEHKADMVIIHNYRQLKHSPTDTKVIPFKEIIQWTNTHSTLPSIGYNSFMVLDKGTDIAIATSAFDQGEVAAKMAIEVLNGKNPKDIPIQSPSNFLIYINAPEWAKSGLKLPQMFISFAKAIKGYIG